jgi:LPS O-antigen subunit length determinant protein (WzzB/FepE family)
VNLPPPSPDVPSTKAPKSALIMIVAVLVGMMTVAIYSNVQRWRRDRIETVIVTPVATPTATPAAMP